MKLLAVDPSLTCSGWALFSVENENLLGVGKIKPLPASYPMGRRLQELSSTISKLLNTLKMQFPDLLICESPTTMKDPSAAIKVEQVRCCFEDMARSLELDVPGRINPRSVHYEVLGLNGKQIERSIIKELAVGTVKRLYSDKLKKLNFASTDEHLKKNQDITDAILI